MHIAPSLLPHTDHWPVDAELGEIGILPTPAPVYDNKPIFVSTLQQWQTSFLAGSKPNQNPSGITISLFDLYVHIFLLGVYNDDGRS